MIDNESNDGRNPAPWMPLLDVLNRATFETGNRNPDAAAGASDESEEDGEESNGAQS